MQSLLAFLLVSTTLGCGSSIIVDGDGDDGDGGDGGQGGSGDCGEPPPSGGGWCPPSWQCVDGEWVDAAGACPEPECPAQVPSSHSPCEMLGQTCDYDELDCGGGEVAECTADGWEIYWPFCEPPLECPDGIPIGGASCEGWDNAWDCYYTVSSSCGDADLYASCDTASYTWTVDMPVTCGGCQYAEAGACEADAACRWAVPGCGENPIPFEGCVPIDGCTAESCGPTATCAAVSVDPCWALLCNACSEDTTVCIPSGE